jgi:multidrug efflux system membrane fusion protein
VAIDDAKLQLDYCTIRSPLKGVTGALLVTQGNLVKVNDTTPLVTITQIEPIYVSFALPEKVLPAVRKRMGKGDLEVKAQIPDVDDAPAVGKLTFIENEVDQSTGTIRMKATFDNADHKLWPGQYVDVVLRLDEVTDAIVAPTQAVQNGQSGPFVYVVKPDMTVELRNIVLGDTQGDLTIVTDGLKPEEKVVTDGQLRLAPGSTVAIAKDTAPQAEAKK